MGEHCVSSWSIYGLKQGIPWHLWFVYILLISRLPNVSNKTYHETGKKKMYAEHTGGLVSTTLCHLIDNIYPKPVNPLAISPLFILLILCLTNVSNKFYHGIGGDQLSAQHKIRNGEC